MSRNAMRRGINNAYSSSLSSKYLERMNENVPRGTKHEVMDKPSQMPSEEGRYVGKFRLRDK